MKREYSNMMRHSNGTYSGIQSTTYYEQFTIFKQSCFNISGYYKAEEEELIELLFLSYAKQGLVVRRIFEQCTFSFSDFTRKQIDDIMTKITVMKTFSGVSYSFTGCRVLSDGLEIENYPLLRQTKSTTFILSTMPEEVKLAGTRSNVEMNYNLRKMTCFNPRERPTFSDEYHKHMKHKRRAILHQKKLDHLLDTNCISYSPQKPSLLCI